MQLDPDKLKAAIEAIKTGDGDAALAILEAILTGATDAGVDGQDDAADAGEGSGADDGAPEGADGTPPDPNAPKAASKLAKLIGCATDEAAAAEFKKLQKRVAALDADHSEIELNARRELIVELVKLGIETPALAWLGTTDEERKKRMPCKRLASEPIAEMRTRVETLKKANPNSGHRPPETGPVDTSHLSAATLAKLKKRGITPEEFVAQKATAARRSA